MSGVGLEGGPAKNTPPWTQNRVGTQYNKRSLATLVIKCTAVQCHNTKIFSFFCAKWCGKHGTKFICQGAQHRSILVCPGEELNKVLVWCDAKKKEWQWRSPGLWALGKTKDCPNRTLRYFEFGPQGEFSKSRGQMGGCLMWLGFLAALQCG